MTQLSTTLPANEARANFYNLIEETANKLRSFIITHRGKPKAVVISIDELESWQETLDVLTENPNIVKDIAKSRKEFKEGKTISLDELIKKYHL